ncbi:MAG TPA: BatD family protein, partial [Bacteroidales bacterium]|nr:BatD family protein [Bacteroidales bacterium]
TNPFVGQEVVITYKLYSRVTVAHYSIEEAPGFQGFWAEDITAEGHPSVSEAVIDGQRYNVAVIRQVVVFPQRAGRLTIEPLEVLSLVRVASPRRTGSLFDDFFSGTGFGAFQAVEHRFRSNPVQINSREVPAQNRPAGFNGAVGNFDLKTDANPLTVNVNEPVSFTLTISGTGNLKMISSPEMELSPHLEVFDPNTTDELKTGLDGMSGHRTFEYLIVPRTRGVFEIPSVRFSFFDPLSRQFVTRTSQSLTIEVAGDALPATLATPGIAQSDVLYLTSDIRFIQNHLFRLQPIGTIFFNSIWYYVLLTLPVVLFGGFILFWKRHVKLRQDIALMKNLKAQKIAKKRLKKASIYLREMKATEFYEEIFKALWGYVSDKFNIPVFKLNKDNVIEVFSHKGINPSLADQFLSTLDECEFARFAPGAPEKRLDETYQRSMEMLVNLEKNLKNG